MQHHDAVTGTEKQHVADDYAHLLHDAIAGCERNAHEILNRITSGIGRQQDKSRLSFSSCAGLNISSCEVSEGSKKFMVTLYNPLAHATSQIVRIPVDDEQYEVMDYRNVPVEIQVVPVPEPIQTLHFRSSNAPYEIVFLASSIPSLGYKSYFVSKKPAPIIPTVHIIANQDYQGDDPNAIDVANSITIGNRYVNLTFDENGLLSEMVSGGVTTRIKQSFHYYFGALGNNEIFANRSSGAYIFRPNGTSSGFKRADIRVVSGDVVDEVHQVNLFTFQNVFVSHVDVEL